MGPLSKLNRLIIILVIKMATEIDKLIQQYQTEITALYIKRRTVSRQLVNLRDKDYTAQHRRLVLLGEMYVDTVYALELLIRSKEGRNRIY